MPNRYCYTLFRWSI